MNQVFNEDEDSTLDDDKQGEDRILMLLLQGHSTAIALSIAYDDIHRYMIDNLRMRRRVDDRFLVKKAELHEIGNQELIGQEDVFDAAGFADGVHGVLGDADVDSADTKGRRGHGADRRAARGVIAHTELKGSRRYI